ncbi:MAG TPA: hypothetical protein VGB85_19950 [Nannocystis sp.]|jgi:hypothetical protein
MIVPFLLKFFAARAPMYSASLRGVSLDDIRLCEKNCSLSFPRTYTDFLVAMGDECGDFHPFGPSQSCDFYELLESFSPDGYPDRYFKVAFESSPMAVTRFDFFLDLQRSDGIDAPLVSFEEMDEFVPQAVQEVGFTLGEQIARRAFDVFEVDRRAFTRTLRLLPASSAEARSAMKLAIATLELQGLSEVLPPLPRVRCLDDDRLSALVELRESTTGARIRLGSADRGDLERCTEQLLERLPDAVVDD